MKDYLSVINTKYDLKDSEQNRRLFDQYKLFLESTTRLVSTRKDTNTLYITLNSVIISTVGTLGGGKIFPDKNLILVAILMMIGIGSVCSWISVLSVYRTIDDENYSIIQELESYFPSCVYSRFHQKVAEESLGHQDKSFMVKKELIIPYSFLIGYVLFIISDVSKLCIHFMNH